MSKPPLPPQLSNYNPLLTYRAAEAGFTKLAERLTRIEDSLLTGTTRGDGTSALDDGSPIGDQLILASQEEKSQGDPYPKQDVAYSAVGSKRSRLNATAPANLEAKRVVSKKATRTGAASSGSIGGNKSASGRPRFGSTSAIADAKQRYAEARRRPIQQEFTANAGDDATMPSSPSATAAARKESSFDSTKQQQQQMELVYKGFDGKIASSAVAVLREDPYYVGDGSPASDAMGLRRVDHQVSNSMIPIVLRPTSCTLTCE